MEQLGREQRVAVLGGGVAGLSAAWKLAEAGVGVDLYEAAPVLGGMAGSMRRNGYIWDFGPHRFHTTNPAILSIIRELVGDDLLDRQRKTRVYFMNALYDYPLTASNLLTHLPKTLAVTSLLDFMWTRAKQRVRPTPDDSFESWVVNRFGKRLYDIYFGPYTAKVWGRHPRDLSASWAAQRVAVVDLWDLILRVLHLRRGDNGFHHSEFKNAFWYPKHGIGQIAEGLARKASEHGANLLTGARITGVEHDGSAIRAVHYRKGDEELRQECDAVVSTLPLPLLVQLLRPAPPDEVLAAARSLEYRAMIFLFLEIDKPSVTDDHWVYFPGPMIFNRISEMRNFSEATVPDDKTSVTLEITCDIGDEVWNMPEDEIFKRAVRELAQAGLIEAHQVTGHFFRRLSHAYPTYDRDFEAKIGHMAYHLADYDNLVNAGRQALFRYVNTDHVMEMGLCAAEELVQGALGTRVERVGSEQVWFG
ncbi:MAG TPA: FAD-dependent oxidoreductase [Thermomicrobiales bacterium]|nr:FAD-dependent oxidoreductase [Thermomicrobiales bacterium]